MKEGDNNTNYLFSGSICPLDSAGLIQINVDQKMGEGGTYEHRNCL